MSNLKPTRFTAVEIRPTNTTAATLAVTSNLSGKVITLNRAAGIAVTLPAATGSGCNLKFFVGTTITSNTTTIKVANASDTMSGTSIALQDAADTVVGFETAADTDTITFNGTTTGGILGDMVELIDIATNKWFVRITGSASGVEATPFSATV